MNQWEQEVVNAGEAVLAAIEKVATGLEVSAETDIEKVKAHFEAVTAALHKFKADFEAIYATAVKVGFVKKLTDDVSGVGKAV